MLGDRTSVAGFRPLGIAVFPAETAEEAREAWPRLVAGEYGVVLVTEPAYEAVADLAAEVVDRPVPAVTVIPGAGRAAGVGQAKLDDAIVRALGTTAFVKEEED
ncbi:MAG: V-type ATP synthase subunit F [Coriobacteriia bacterium]|nr:V-type ATP synthase subunit F [Coriobacteriia bacterium]